MKILYLQVFNYTAIYMDKREWNQALFLHHNFEIPAIRLYQQDVRTHFLRF